MAWSVPLTAASNTALTASQWNQSVRDNLLMTAPALATTAGRLFVTTGPNTIAERAVLSASVATDQTTTSLTYADLTTGGPAVTLTTGAQALVSISAGIRNSTAGEAGYAGLNVSGATTVGPSDIRAIKVESNPASQHSRVGISMLETGLTAGSNVFTVKYRVTAGTGTFGNRSIVVVGL